jgi:hypothetical protein
MSLTSQAMRVAEPGFTARRKGRARIEINVCAFADTIRLWVVVHRLATAVSGQAAGIAKWFCRGRARAPGSAGAMALGSIRHDPATARRMSMLLRPEDI